METVQRGVPCGVNETQVVNCKWLSDVNLLKCSVKSKCPLARYCKCKSIVGHASSSGLTTHQEYIINDFASLLPALV